MSEKWVRVRDRKPKAGKVVLTKIEDEKGERNKQELKMDVMGNSWFLSDGSMYVYYTPTHWLDV